ncbi:hypothetical protein MSG28_010869 [Choristoneura fumiferana]|uniref:Uncharacterized protein n=1 Tax=Choristoneura fumiferana TaxID=7141 RepID=A0ACC0KNZ6_CHOFU|nr:hypothetical protein MSG28_010869 [Choristoneura fumiferana]
MTEMDDVDRLFLRAPGASATENVAAGGSSEQSRCEAALSAASLDGARSARVTAVTCVHPPSSPSHITSPLLESDCARIFQSRSQDAAGAWPVVTHVLYHTMQRVR